MIIGKNYKGELPENVVIMNFEEAVNVFESAVRALKCYKDEPKVAAREAYSKVLEMIKTLEAIKEPK